MDRHVIANVSAELGATTTVLPSDDETRRYLRTQQREDAWSKLRAGGLINCMRERKAAS